jgi:hypothetical protein
LLNDFADDIPIEIPISLVEGLSVEIVDQLDFEDEQKSHESQLEVVFSEFSVKDISLSEGSTREYLITESQQLYLIQMSSLNAIVERQIRSLKIVVWEKT